MVINGIEFEPTDFRINISSFEGRWGGPGRELPAELLEQWREHQPDKHWFMMKLMALNTIRQLKATRGIYGTEGLDTQETMLVELLNQHRFSRSMIEVSTLTVTVIYRLKLFNQVWRVAIDWQDQV